MARTVLFAKEQTYEDNRRGIFIPVILGSGVEEVELLAKIDTGADVCVFQHKYGELIGYEQLALFSSYD